MERKFRISYTAQGSAIRSLSLLPKSQYSLDFFVVHSGVVEAYAILDNAISNLASTSETRLIYFFGIEGTGKTHLLNGFRLKASELKIPDTQLLFCDDFLKDTGATTYDKDEKIATFISSYQRIKSEGGLIVISSRVHPKELINNPHISSRLLSGEIAQIYKPQDSEIRAIISSILEKNNLRPSESSINALKQLMPTNPLECSEIVNALNAELLSSGQKAGRRNLESAVKKILRIPHKGNS